MRCLLALALALSSPRIARADDWPMVNHDAARTGRTTDCPRAPFRVVWVRQFPGELMTTRAEAIVAGGRVFVGTYAGRMHALDAATGRERWTAQLDGPILHSAACRDGRVFCGTAAGTIYSLSEASGRTIWRASPGDYGFDTAPLLVGGLVIMGSRGGTLFAIDAKTGAGRWAKCARVPIRTTASSDGRHVFYAAEDMRGRACDLRTGRPIWMSDPLPGQSLRDYCPVVVGDRLILRSNPVGPFAERLAADRHMLAANAGVDDRDWRKLDAFLKSNATNATQKQIRDEQDSIRDWQRREPDARTFFILDAATGRESARAPILYTAGCQGVGPPPALTDDGRVIAFWRTAYSNWNLGVAPMVGLGILDPRTGHVEPLRHADGAQPPWNTFWGTADETTRFTVGGGTVFISHQGTLSGFDLASRHLFPIAGSRDTWGGYSGLPWARNEWHGPARGSVAISGDHLYWITGSRVIAVRGGARSTEAVPGPEPALPRPPAVSAGEPPLPSVEAIRKDLIAGWEVRGPKDARRSADQERRRLETAVEEVLAGPWKPLYVQAGLSGREFLFRHSSETFQALSAAYPVLRPAHQQRVREYLAAQWKAFPPYSQRGSRPLDVGKPREWCPVPDSLRIDDGPAPPPIVYASATELYVRNVGGIGRLREAWPGLRSAFGMYQLSDGRLRPDRAGLWDTRIVAGLIAYARMAREMRDATAEEALDLAAAGLRTLIQQARAYDPATVEKSISSVNEVDRFIGAGDDLFVTVKPHRAKLARLIGITPEIGRALRAYAGHHLRALLATVYHMMPGWYLVGEERQVHFGENFIDPPDQALAIFTARVDLETESPAVLRRWIDLPFCRADLYDIEKRAAWIRAAEGRSQATARHREHVRTWPRPKR